MHATHFDYPLSAFFEPGDTKHNSLHLTVGLPKVIQQAMTAARFHELAGTGAIPPFVKLAGIAGVHAWQIEATYKPYHFRFVVFDVDLLTNARTAPETLDLLDQLRDALENVPAMRSAVMRAIVSAVPAITDEQRHELDAYARAAGM